MPSAIVRPATRADLPALLEIYNDAVRTLPAIWTETEDSFAARAAWFDERRAAGFPVLVVGEGDGRVMGYASYGPYRSKPGYRLTVEHSIYMAPEARGRGLGTPLMAELLTTARREGYHLMVAVIEANNAGSIRFHERFGFVRTGLLEEPGFKHGAWLSEVMMSLRLSDGPPPTRI